MASPQQLQAAACSPCDHFERGGTYDAEDVLARKILRYPLTGEDVRRESMALIERAFAESTASRLVVHVEKGRQMVRLSVTSG